MKIYDRIKNDLVGEIYTQDELDIFMEKEKYFPFEFDEDDELGIFKYSNSRSQIWVKYIKGEGDYLITDVTHCVKKKGKNEVHAIKNPEDIKKIMDYFKKNDIDCFLIMMLELCLGRRIGDTLSLKWSDLYEENGSKKSIIDTIIEQKTGKTVEIRLSDPTWRFIDEYCKIKSINPMEKLNEDVFNNDMKNQLNQKRLKEHMNENEYNKLYYEIIKKQGASFRYELSKACKEYNIKNVSTHSFRKTFGYWAHQLNPFDPDNVDVLQLIFGHSDRRTTLIYIDVMKEKGDKLFDTVANFMADVNSGKKYSTKNLPPVVSIHTNDLRDVLESMYKMGAEGVDGIKAMNDCLNKIENLRVGI